MQEDVREQLRQLRRLLLRPRALVLSLLFLALWLLFTHSLLWQELLLGLGMAVLATVATILAGWGAGIKLAPRWTWLLLIPALVTSVLRETAMIFAVLLQRLAGKRLRSRLATAPFHFGSDTPRDKARRAAALLLSTVSPNFIALDLDKETNVLLYHQLIPAPPSPVVVRLSGKQGKERP